MTAPATNGIVKLIFFFSSRRLHTRWPRHWSSDVCSSDLHFLHQQQAEHQICPNLCRLIEHMAAHCQQIGQRVRQGSLGGILGSTEQENVQGEIQQKLDIIANDMLLDNQHWHAALAGDASEEMDQVMLLEARTDAPELLWLVHRH